MFFVNTSSVSYKAFSLNGIRVEKAVFRSPRLHGFFFYFKHSPRPYIDAVFFRTTVYFIENSIRNNTPVYIPNDVSGHCYIVNAVQILLLEKLRRNQKFC